MEKVEIKNDNVLKCAKCGIEIQEGKHCDKCVKRKGYTINFNKRLNKIMEKWNFTLRDLFFYALSYYGKDKITHEEKEQMEIDAWKICKELKIIEFE